jgi:hypothetical protein
VTGINKRSAVYDGASFVPNIKGERVGRRVDLDSERVKCGPEAKLNYVAADSACPICKHNARSSIPNKPQAAWVAASEDIPVCGVGLAAYYAFNRAVPTLGGNAGVGQRESVRDQGVLASKGHCGKQKKRDAHGSPR